MVQGSAFTVPAVYAYGNLGRNALTTQSFWNLHFSVFRQFSTEGSGAEERIPDRLRTTPSHGLIALLAFSKQLGRALLRGLAHGCKCQRGPRKASRQFY